MSPADASAPDPNFLPPPPEKLPPGLLKPTPRNFHVRTYGYCDKLGLDGGAPRLRSEFGNTIEGQREFEDVFRYRINYVPDARRG